jgi:hypothetical protein
MGLNRSRGRVLGQAAFAKLIWKNSSPKWDFDDATFDRTAASFNNSDHVIIVIHNYRWRLSLAAGDPQYDDLERKLNEAPVIAVPTITIASDFDGGLGRNILCQAILRQIFAPNPQGHRSQCASRTPQAFAAAVVEVDGY